MPKQKLRLALASLTWLFAFPAFAEYGTSWTFALACPAHGVTSGSGSATISSGGFSTTGGTCSRFGNQFGKYSFSGASGGTLNSSTVYPIQAGKLAFMPPLRNTDTTPVFAVEVECPTRTVEVNWIHILSAASRTGEYFWGRSTMAPTSTTMTKFYNVAGTEGFSGSHSLPIGTCSAGVYDVSGDNDFLAKMNAANDWTGFYRTSPGNTTFFAPVWTITSSYLGSKTWAGMTFNAQQSNSSKSVRVTSDAAGTTFTIKPLSDVETDTLASGSSSYTETITITNINSPLNGMMRGTISRVDSFDSPQGTTENIGCVAYDSGTGGFVIACGGKSPLDNTKNYALTFNYKSPSGSLDVTFNGTGKVTTPIGGDYAEANGVAIQSDGKIVLAGYSNNGTDHDFAVARYNSDGSLDTTFNSTGILTTAFASSHDEAYALAMQSDGKIVAAGYSDNGSNLDFAVVRYTSSGSLDTSFNSTGKASTTINGFSDDRARAVAIQSDGKIVLAGHASSGSGNDFAVVRYTSSGSLDTSFNSTGKVYTDITSSEDTARAVAIQSDGKIVLAGYSHNGSDWDFSVVRYNSSGSLDTSFNSTGKVITPIGSTDDYARALAIQSDGKIVLAGYSHNGSDDDFVVVRYNSNGSLDTSFNSTGKVTTSVASSYSLYDGATAVAIQSDGKIVAAGYSDEGGNDFAVVRYNTDGSLDTHFNSTGKVTTAIGGSSDTAYAVTIQSDGKIVAAGTSDSAQNPFAVIRLIP